MDRSPGPRDAPPQPAPAEGRPDGPVHDLPEGPNGAQAQEREEGDGWASTPAIRVAERYAARAAPSYSVAPVAVPSLAAASVGGLVAALSAWGGMTFLRSTLQVRSVPERVMEWLLLFVPLDLFEAGLRRFGFDAKRYALYGGVLVTIALLAALGAAVLRRRWSSEAIFVLGIALWLSVMVVIMPLTSAGFFAAKLISGTKAAVGGYLAVALTYAAVLAMARAWLVRDDLYAPASAAPGRGAVWRMGTRERLAMVPPWIRGSERLREAWLAQPASRRSTVPLVGGTLAAYAATFAAVRFIPSRDRLTPIIVSDPQEPVPSGGIDPPNAHPSAVETQRAGTLPARVPTAAGSVGAFEPPPARQITRDKDGAALPSGRRPGQLAEVITNNNDFYIVTKNAGGDPVLRLNDWRLRIDGEVQRTVEVDYASLRRLPSVEVTKTLECISNFVAKCELAPFGCDLISTARWKGVRVSDVLALAGGVKPGAVTLATLGADEYSTSLPIQVAMAPDTLVVYEMNGQVLPREHGYPLRMLVPGRYGMKNAKWIVGLRVMNREFVDWYGQRNWSRDAVVKTMTRIDVPAAGATLIPGEQRIAGIAYAGDRGVSRVDYSADGGATWQVADFLEQPAGLDVWVRWQGRFTIAPGTSLTLVARATDGTGALQPEPFALPQPDGGAGWCTAEVRA